jgi:thioredoxin-dependent peroxiredoxin
MVSEQNKGVFIMSTGSNKLTVGDNAPDFTLPTQKAGEPFHLHDILGKSAVVIYFYPKDDTPGCTAEACSFRDSYEVFKDAGAEVIGISTDSTQSHQQFASKYNLPFILLSDKGGVVQDLYGVPAISHQGMTFASRVTYVIDKQGVVKSIFADLPSATQHAADALKTLRELA